MARAMATATVTFGLVAIPVKVYVGASAEAVSFNMINPDTGNRLKQKLVDAGTNAEVDRSKTVRGFEFSKGQFVLFDNAELKALEGTTNKMVDVREFVPADTVDPLCVEKTYYLGPDKGGDKPYTLLAETLAATNTVGVAQWSNRGREHLVTIAAHEGGLVMRLMYYAAEVRDFAEITGSIAKLTITDPERQMAAQLVAHLAKPTYDPSVYVDTYAERVQKAVTEKAAGNELTIAAAAPNAAILDVFAALKASLAAAQGEPLPEAPPAEATPGPAKARRKRSTKKTEAA